MVYFFSLVPKIFYEPTSRPLRSTDTVCCYGIREQPSDNSEAICIASWLTLTGVDIGFLLTWNVFTEVSRSVCETLWVVPPDLRKPFNR